MIKTRFKYTKPGDYSNGFKILGCEFELKGKWYVVCECKCRTIGVLDLSNIMRGIQKCIVCRRKKPKLLKGDIFGFLTVESEPYYDISRKENKWRIKASCKCGWVGEVSAKLILKNRIHHKGCKYYCQGKYNGAWKGIGKLSGSLWNAIKHNAKNRNIKFNISMQYAYELYESQNAKCTLTNWDLVIDKNWPDYKEITASLDRIDSSKDYIEGNIQWIHKFVNRCKFTFDEQYFIDLCFLVSNYNKNLPLFERQGNISISFWNRIKNNSSKGQPERLNRKNIKFNINIKYAYELLLSQQNRCNYTGIPLLFTSKGYSKNHTASLDRIDSNKGYIKGNVQWVHKDINIMKNFLSHDKFIEICDSVSQNNKPSKNCMELIKSC